MKLENNWAQDYLPRGVKNEVIKLDMWVVLYKYHLSFWLLRTKQPNSVREHCSAIMSFTKSLIYMCSVFLLAEQMTILFGDILYSLLKLRTEVKRLNHCSLLILTLLSPFMCIFRSKPTGDFNLFKLNPHHGLYVKGFGQAFSLSGAELLDVDWKRDGHHGTPKQATEEA